MPVKKFIQTNRKIIRYTIQATNSSQFTLLLKLCTELPIQAATITDLHIKHTEVHKQKSMLKHFINIKSNKINKDIAIKLSKLVEDQTLVQ